jgi:hypothetical protein
MNLQDLLTKGYLPRELPPSFSSQSFGVLASAGTLPADFTSFSQWTRPVQHNLTRAGQLDPRHLSIPNPVSFCQLAALIVDEWPKIEGQIGRGSLSASRPIDDPNGVRCMVPQYGYADLAALRAKHRVGARYILSADISRFYGSIYTHTIEWALDGKAAAKAAAKAKKANTNGLGKQLDKRISSAQDGQTIGIPIGPDTSLVVAELLLSAVDQHVLASMKLNGFRYIDDYELGFSSRAEAEAAYVLLQQALAEFELAPNPAKTAIRELPEEFDPGWTAEIRRLDLSYERKAQQQHYRLIDFFNRAFQLAKQYPNDSVLRYAISRTRAFDIAELNWMLYQAFLYQSMIADPGCLPHVLERILEYHAKFRGFASESLHQSLNTVIRRSASLGYGSDVAWALWGTIGLNVPLEKGAIEAVSRMRDPVVALLALDARDKGLIKEEDLDTSHWQTCLTDDGLHREQWLLSYESAVHGWLTAADGNDHLAGNPCFDHLRKNGVRFYDSSAVPAADQVRRAWDKSRFSYFEIP